MSRTTPSRWLLLIHQIPRKPDYLRIKVGRRLQKIGAVAIKNSVYALPRNERAHEDLQWVRREIVDGGGDATVCEAHFVEGLHDHEIEALFHGARNADYAKVEAGAHAARKRLGRRTRLTDDDRARVAADLARLRRHLDDAAAIDFFGAPGRQGADDAIAVLERRLHEPGAAVAVAPAPTVAPPRGTTWVTRKGIHVDRMASAWLIRRFIDPDAVFKFVPPQDYEPTRGEVRFDMYGGEFTHEGGACSFEVLAMRLKVHDAAVEAIGQIVHDLDVRDGKFDRLETPGVGLVVTGLCLAHAEDDARLEAASILFDALHAAYRRRAP